MIRTIFFPEKIGSYYLFTVRIAACEITRSYIRATLVKASGKDRIIEKIVEKPIAGDVTLTYQERVANTLQEVFAQLGKYDKVSAIMTSNVVITKELTLPFVNVDKIKMILPFEMEPLLPFPLADATVDCIITDTKPDTTTILAFAVKNDMLIDQIGLFEKAGIQTSRVTVDLVELYALYKELNPESKQNVVLLYMGLQTSRVGIVVNGQLKATRLLPQGALKLAKLFNKESEQMIHSGLDEDIAAATEQAKPFFADIAFTLQSFTAKMPADQKFQKIIIMGTAADIKGMPTIVENIFQIPCEVIPANIILQSGLAAMGENHGIPNNSLIAVSTALSLPVSQDFNLLKVAAEAEEEKAFNYRMIAALGLALLVIGSILISGFLNARKIKQEIEASEKEAVAKLKKDFPSLSARYGSTGLDAIKNAARAEVAREKNIWFALSTQHRDSFLHYLQELFTRLDATGLGLIITRLSLDEDTLNLEGSVKDFEALKQLEEDLRQSKLFTNVPRLQELKFSVKITLDKSYGEG